MKKYGSFLLIMGMVLTSCGMKDNSPQATLRNGTYSSTNAETGAVENLTIDESAITFTDSKGAAKKWYYKQLKRADIDFTFTYSHDKDKNKLPAAVIKKYNMQLKAYPTHGSAFYFLQLDGGKTNKDNQLVVIRFANGVVNTVAINGPNYQQANQFLETDKYLGGTMLGSIFLPMAPGNLVFYFNHNKKAAPLEATVVATTRPTPKELVAKTWIRN